MAGDTTTSLPENTQSTLQLIQSHAPELLITILTHVPDRQTLRNVVLSCGAFSRVYLRYRRQILLELTRNAFEVDGVNIAIPLLACRVNHVDAKPSNRLEIVTALLESNSERRKMTKQESRRISIEECKRMLQLKDVASQICSDLISQTSLSHPLGKDNIMGLKPVSLTERCRISIAIYRWGIWAGLSHQRARYLRWNPGTAAETAICAQKAVFTARYTE